MPFGVDRVNKWTQQRYGHIIHRTHVGFDQRSLPPLLIHSLSPSPYPTYQRILIPEGKVSSLSLLEACCLAYSLVEWPYSLVWLCEMIIINKKIRHLGKASTKLYIWMGFSESKLIRVLIWPAIQEQSRLREGKERLLKPGQLLLSRIEPGSGRYLPHTLTKCRGQRQS